MKNRLLLTIIALIAISFKTQSQTTGTFTDTRDGKVYKTVTIGTQTWMVENLSYKASEGCCAYNNDNSNVAKYGYLYTWEAAKTACPEGWHIPSYEEWSILLDHLGGKDVAGSKMKATTDWEFDAEGIATNESGFNALPAGSCDGRGSFNKLGSNAFFWSMTSGATEEYALGFRLYNYQSKVNRNDLYRINGCSVRCIKNS